MIVLEECSQMIRSLSSMTFLSRLEHDLPHAEIFLVGGTVRDWLLHRHDGHADIDLVIRGVAFDTLSLWLQKHGTVSAVGSTFRVLKFRPNGHSEEIDIALPRTEQSTPNSQGGYRDVLVTADPNLPIETDLERRDFTINAMALHLKTSVLIDPFDGQGDLSRKVIRTVGKPEERFREDLTRLLRGIRFAVQLNFHIDPDTLRVMRAYIGNINQIYKIDGSNQYVVSRDMIGDELSKSFDANAAITASFLQQTSALEELFPVVWQLAQADPYYFEPLSHVAAHQSEEAIILFLRGLSPDDVRTSLSFSGLDTLPKKSPRRLDPLHIVWMIERLQERHTPQSVSHMRASHFEKQFLGERGMQHKQLLQHLGRTHVVQAVAQRHTEICTHWNCDEKELIPALITGEDLLRLGVPHGPRIRDLLELVRDQQLDGHLMTRESALTWIKKQATV